MRRKSMLFLRDGKTCCKMESIGLSTNGQYSASSFINGIHKAVEQISSYPTIGMLDRKRSNTRFKYHSLLLHPKYRLIYRVSKNTIRIVAIQCNLMNNEN